MKKLRYLVALFVCMLFLTQTSYAEESQVGSLNEGTMSPSDFDTVGESSGSVEFQESQEETRGTSSDRADIESTDNDDGVVAPASTNYEKMLDGDKWLLPVAMSTVTEDMYTTQTNIFEYGVESLNKSDGFLVGKLQLDNRVPLIVKELTSSDEEIDFLKVDELTDSTVYWFKLKELKKNSMVGYRFKIVAPNQTVQINGTLSIVLVRNNRVNINQAFSLSEVYRSNILTTNIGLNLNHKNFITIVDDTFNIHDVVEVVDGISIIDALKSSEQYNPVNCDYVPRTTYTGKKRFKDFEISECNDDGTETENKSNVDGSYLINNHLVVKPVFDDVVKLTFTNNNKPSDMISAVTLPEPIYVKKGVTLAEDSIQLSSLPVVDKYTFGNWKNGDIDINSDSVFNNDVLLNINWLAPYVITFNANKNNEMTSNVQLPENIKVVRGQKLGTAISELPILNAVDKYTFNCWRDGIEGDIITLDSIINSNITCYADWFAPCRITFNIKRNSYLTSDIDIPSDILVEKGKALNYYGIKLVTYNPIDYCTFDGWYIDSSTKFTENISIEQDMVIDGKFLTPKIYTFKCASQLPYYNYLKSLEQVKVAVGYAFDSEYSSCRKFPILENQDGYTFEGWAIRYDEWDMDYTKLKPKITDESHVASYSDASTIMPVFRRPGFCSLFKTVVGSKGTYRKFKKSPNSFKEDYDAHYNYDYNSRTDVSQLFDGSVISWHDSSTNTTYWNSETGVVYLAGYRGSYNYFYDCSKYDLIDLTDVDTSYLVNMSNLFDGCSSANIIFDENRFVTTKATNMSSMFKRCSKITDLSNITFNTNNVIDMSNMFYGCSSLKTLNLSEFNTSNVTNMNAMFYGCKALPSIDCSRFDFTNVRNIKCMFTYCSKATSINLSSLRHNNFGNTDSLFAGCSSLRNLDISNLDTSNVTTMASMFKDCSSLSSININKLNMSNVTTCRDMFNGSGITYVDMSKCDLSNVKDISSIFSSCKLLEAVNFGDRKNIFRPTNTYGVFSGCAKLTDLNIDRLDTSQSTNMSNMFMGCSSIKNIDISLFDTSNVVYFTKMFCDCTQLPSLDIRHFNTSSVTDMEAMFRNCRALNNLDLNNFDTSKVTNMEGMFAGCTVLNDLKINNFNTSNVYDMTSLFSDCKSFVGLDLRNFDTSKLRYASYMFSGCTGLDNLDISSFVTDNVVSMVGMFSNCAKLQAIDVSRFNTAKVYEMNSMFSGCNKLRNLNLSSFNTEKVERCDYMFSNCIALTSLDLRSFKLPIASDTSGMFNGCINLGSILFGDLNCQKSRDMSHMFNDCSNLTSLDLSSLGSSKNVDFDRMFSGCTKLTNIIYNENFICGSSAYYLNKIFYNCPANKPNWSGTWDSDGTYKK